MKQELKDKILAFLDAAQIQCDEIIALRDKEINALNMRISELEAILQLQTQ